MKAVDDANESYLGEESIALELGHFSKTIFKLGFLLIFCRKKQLINLKL